MELKPVQIMQKQCSRVTILMLVILFYLILFCGTASIIYVLLIRSDRSRIISYQTELVTVDSWSVTHLGFCHVLDVILDSTFTSYIA